MSRICVWYYVMMRGLVSWILTSEIASTLGLYREAVVGHLRWPT